MLDEVVQRETGEGVGFELLLEVSARGLRAGADGHRVVLEVVPWLPHETDKQIYQCQ